MQITCHERTRKWSNKMNGMKSLNTSMTNNPFCQRMHENKNLICSSCYANKIEKIYKGVKEKYSKNSILLSKRILKNEEIPFINSTTFRFHAVGELINDIHYINFQNIVKKNPHCVFTLWTKRIDIVQRNFKKLENFIHIYSSPVKNEIAKKPKNFDKVFTVFNSNFIIENKIKINCQKACLTCLKCYTLKDKSIFINEKIK